MFDKDKLIKLIKGHALEVRSPEEEPFRLASGGTSRFYLDLRKLTLHDSGLHLIVDMLWEELCCLRLRYDFQAIGGVCVGADPIVGGLLYCYGYHSNYMETRGFLIRKEAKDHGQKGRIIGSVKPGDNCILVEDVVTTGGSLLDAIACLEECRVSVGVVLAVVDRGSVAREKFNARGIAYQSLLTATDLGVEVG